MSNKRLQKEVLQLNDKSLKEQGIFYFIEEEQLTKGTAILFGPKDTPYEFCPLEYKFEISDDYPFSPPKVFYRTNDGITRFHPNFYIDGKVCLSILGTYSGPKWASTMNISTILLSIFSLMTNNPLTNEPCYETTSLNNPKNHQYAEYVEHQMIKLFLMMYETGYYNKYKDLDIKFKETIEKNYELIKNKIYEKSKNNEILFTILPYNMVGSTMYRKLVAKYEKN
jgi:ubiquitin-protein ligase